ETCQSSVKRAVLDITRHFLRTDQHALQLRIVRARIVRAPIRINLETGRRKQRDRCVLQTTFWNSQADFSHYTTSELVAAIVIGFVKQERVPSWHTSPSPSTRTRHSTVSLSQSVAAEITRSRFPLVSPFVQSLFRVRLKKVT